MCFFVFSCINQFYNNFHFGMTRQLAVQPQLDSYIMLFGILLQSAMVDRQYHNDRTANACALFVSIKHVAKQMHALGHATMVRSTSSFEYFMFSFAVQKKQDADGTSKMPEDELTCSVCLEQVLVGDLVRSLPCLHQVIIIPTILQLFSPF